MLQRLKYNCTTGAPAWCLQGDTDIKWLKDIDCKVLIKFQQKLLKQQAEQWIVKFINSIWNKESLIQQWKESIIVPIYKKG